MEFKRGKCKCGHEFTINDKGTFERVAPFFGGICRHISKTRCPKCKTETTLALKQKGQTYVVVGYNQEVKDEEVFEKAQEAIEKVETEAKVETNTDEKSAKYICRECGKECKSKIGLTAHEKSHSK